MTYKGEEIENPTVDMLKEYIHLKGFKNLSAEEIFSRYQNNGWRTLKGTPVKSIEAVINIYNGLVNPNSSRKKKVSYQSEKYKDLLQKDEWKAFREKVLELHNYKCDECDETDNLHVHHKRYRKRGNELALPWAYYFDDMAVLCENHHTEAHHILYINKV